MFIKKSILFVLVSCSFLLISNKCKREKQKNTAAKVTTETMENGKITTNFKFNQEFDANWNKVDSLDEIGMYASALNYVNQIFDKAKTNNETPDMIRALFYRLKYHRQLKEDDHILAIKELELLAKSEVFPSKQLIHSITAQVYWNYYTQNRWKINNRTKTFGDEENLDIESWDLTRFQQKIAENYTLSLLQPALLQKTSLIDFEKILVFEQNSTTYFPTLYDFLANTALDFYLNEEASASKPIDFFKFDKEIFFESTSIFSNEKFVLGGTIESSFLAIELFQKLELAHQTDADHTSSIFFQLRRLKYVLDKSTLENKVALYENALLKLLEKEKNTTTEEVVKMALAHHFVDLIGESENKKELTQKALALAEEVIASKKTKHGLKDAQNLKNQVFSKNLEIQSESIISTDFGIELLVNYKNIDKLYFQLVRLPENFKYNYNTSNALHQELLKFSKGDKWEKKLLSSSDHLEHSMLITLPSQLLGRYAVLASNDPAFSGEKTVVNHHFIRVSNLICTSSSRKNDLCEIQVFDKSTGKPQNKVDVEFTNQKYKNGDWINQVIEKIETDENGIVNYKCPKNQSINCNLRFKNDYLPNAASIYAYNDEDIRNTSTKLFIDRAIYRPGQTIFFKGLMMKSLRNKHNLLKNTETIIELRDANYQLVSKLNVKSNEFGTFAGSFILPNAGLTGNMSLVQKNGNVSFSVEEYKRPKFEVVTQPLLGAYKLNQEISVNGQAIAFSGGTIDNAKVSYSVKRTTYFPWWCYWRFGYMPYNRDLVEIAHGELLTDSQGNFKINFIAKTDNSIDDKFKPNYTYQLEASVTDVSGETHSLNTNVTVGFECLKIQNTLKEVIVKNENTSFQLLTQNLNGQPLPASVNMSITKLIEPERLLRKSLSGKPEFYELNQEEYIKQFPNNPIGDESEMQNWKKGNVVLQKTIESKGDEKVNLENISTWSQGVYEVKFESKDPFGEDVYEVKYLKIVDPTLKTNALNQAFYAFGLQTACEPGEKASILIGTAREEAFVRYDVTMNNTVLKSETVRITKGQKVIEFPIKEEHRGNVYIRVSSVFQGDFISEEFTIMVPFSNKELTITFETFRDKLLPGQAETWKIKIAGPKGEKVASELLIAMYDASLDAFRSIDYQFSPYNSNTSSWVSEFGRNLSYGENWLGKQYNNEYSYLDLENGAPHFNWFGYENGNYALYFNSAPMESRMEVYSFSDSENDNEYAVLQKGNGKGIGLNEVSKGAYSPLLSDKKNRKEEKSSSDQNNSEVQIRKNMQETAFFYPQLKTDAEGNTVVNFTAPDALTRWKINAWAHSMDLKIGNIQKELITQKELMVQANAPRFIREGDRFGFAGKITNLAETDLSGEVELKLFDALTMNEVNAAFKNTNQKQRFEVKKGASIPINFEIEVPFGVSALTYQLIAKSKNHSDGEEMTIPILSNRMLVTETMPMPSRGIGVDQFKFEKLLQSGASTSIKNHRLTLEYTSNPAWNAVQSLPYLMEYPHECAEQRFSRMYANALGAHIINSSPRIKSVIDEWAKSSPETFLSNLEKNKELKSVILEETPWVLDAKNESGRKQRISQLFEFGKMRRQFDDDINKLLKMQLSSGAWPWFEGMQENEYITQTILTGFGRLDHLNVSTTKKEDKVQKMIQKALLFLDLKMIEKFETIKKYNIDYLKKIHISEFEVNYLYMRSFYSQYPIPEEAQNAINYFEDQARTYWLQLSLPGQAMISIQQARKNNFSLAKLITTSLKERSITTEEMGMYWKSNVSGYSWYEAPIETQALMIEAFDEVAGDEKSVESLKVWLLKNKQTNDWKTTKSTVDACYALLLRGTSILENTEMVSITVGGKKIDPVALGLKAEAGTGYFKTAWQADNVLPTFGDVSVERKTEGVSWGAMYWQYFEDLDKITSAATNLSIEKQLFVVKNTDQGEQMIKIENDKTIKIGDKVRVRIILKSDRAMEYVHLKDMRAASLEPKNVFSTYKWQGGLGYYESTKDVATHFFIDYLPKGTFVFEYDCSAGLSGDFSSGIASIECMYAPEFNAHSKGDRLNVEK